jgi:hypothetical protein
MKLFVLAYDNEDDVRNEVITFLHENGGTEIRQCVQTTYQFKSDNNKDVVWWDTQINNQLSLGYYMINEVKLGDRRNNAGNRFFELKRKCDDSLQKSAQEILDKLKE